MKDILATVKERFSAATDNQRNRFDKFNDFDYVYHSRLKKYDPNVPSRIFNPIVWSFIETIVTRMLAKSPEIEFKPRERSDDNTAKVASDLFSYWFDKTEAYPVIVEWVKNALIYGTGILKVDWYTSQPRTVKQYQLDQMGQPMMDENGQFIYNETMVQDCDDPRIQNVNLYDFFFDKNATSIDNAQWVIHQYNMTIDELMEENRQANKYGKVVYNRNKLADLKASKLSDNKTVSNQYENERRNATGWGNNEEDTTVNRVKIWEMWENNRVVMVADEQFVIRDEENPYWHGRKPFIRLVDSILPSEFYGKGEIEPVEKLIHALNTTQNQRIVNVNRILSPTWEATDRVDDDELQFIDNGIIHVTELKRDVDMFQMPNVTGTSVQEQQLIIETIQRALGVTDYVQGLSTPGQTAAEVQVKTSQANARFSHKVQIFEEIGLKRLGELVYKLYQQFITREKVIRITGAEGEKYIPVTPADLVGEYDVIPVSESTLNVDQQGEFSKFLNLFQILSPLFQRTVQTPMGPQSTGFVDEQEMVKELLSRSGEKDPQRFFLKEENGTGQVSGDVSGVEQGQAGQGQEVTSPEAALLQAFGGNGQQAGMAGIGQQNQ